jgi:hypothetical protein
MHAKLKLNHKSLKDPTDHPMTSITKALKKANIEYLGLISKRPLTHKDRERIVELQNTITNFGVSRIFTYFY